MTRKLSILIAISFTLNQLGTSAAGTDPMVSRVSRSIARAGIEEKRAGTGALVVRDHCDMLDFKYGQQG